MKVVLLNKGMTQRSLSIISYCLFSTWLLSFLFEGQVLYSLIENAKIDGTALITLAVLTVFIGLLTSGFLVKRQAAVKMTMIISCIVCISGSLIFFLPFSMLWYIAIITTAYFASLFIASWGFFFKIYFNAEERFKIVADVLIYSNVLMIIVNVLTVSMSAYIGLAITIIAILGALFTLFRLEANPEGQAFNKVNPTGSTQVISAISKPFIFLYMFILIITIDSGLMYQVVNPAFAHYGLLTTYYWAVPYILALLILRNLNAGIKKAYILYVAIVMIGIAYISFMWLDRSITSYLIINTLMLGAFGVCDLFWWSILGSYLDYHDNAAQIFGAGLSMNVLGVLLGGIIGNKITSVESHYLLASVIALVVVFTALIILPVLNFQLNRHLKDHEFLMKFTGVEEREQGMDIINFKVDKQLTEKETEVVKLLLKGYTYKVIAKNLFISENTIKYHIKNIYQKLNINNKMELIKIFADNNK